MDKPPEEMRKQGEVNILFHATTAARHFLEEIWPDWQEHTRREFNVPVPRVMSSGTCGRSSTFLVKVLNECAVEGRIAHGWFRGASQAAEGKYICKHAWVTAGRWIIDITADQFGAVSKSPRVLQFDPGQLVLVMVKVH